MSRSFGAAALMLALPALNAPALAAGCAGPADTAAIRTAVLQQQLMVAAFQCREADAYNRFVSANRSELLSSDARLKTYFTRHGGEGGYDAFKTRAANLAALEQARDANGFCANAHALFVAAAARQGDLAGFVASRTQAGKTGDYCGEAPAMAVVAAAPDTGIVAGVPQHGLPAIGTLRQDGAPATGEARAADNSSARYARLTRQRRLGPENAPLAYGPPRWRDPPPDEVWYGPWRAR